MIDDQIGRHATSKGALDQLEWTNQSLVTKNPDQGRIHDWLKPRFAGPLFLLCLAAAAYGFGAREFALLLVAVFAITVVVAAVYYEKVAWVIYVLALTTSALSIDVAGAKLLPEHLAIVVLATHALRHRQQKKIWSFNGSLVFGVVLVGLWWVCSFAISALSAPNATQSIRLLIWVLANIFAGLLVFRLSISTRFLINSGLIAMSFAGVIYTLVWVFSTSTGNVNVFVERDYATTALRLNGLMPEPNLFAAYFVLWAFIAYSARGLIKTSLIIIFLAVSAVCCLLSVTRVAWLLMAIIILLFLIHASKRNAGLVGFLGIIAVGVIAYLALNTQEQTSNAGSFLSTLLERLPGFFDFSSGTGGLRLLTVQSALTDLNVHGRWMTGFGFNAYPQIHPTGVTTWATSYLSVLWVAIFYDSGVIGAAAFIIGFLAVTFATRKSAGIWFFVAFALLSTTTNPIWYAFPWILASLLARLEQDRSHDSSYKPIERLTTKLVSGSSESAQLLAPKTFPRSRLREGL